MITEIEVALGSRPAHSLLAIAGLTKVINLTFGCVGAAMSA